MTGLIEIEGLQYTYPQSRRPALEDLSLKVDSGEFVLLAGPSGAGKSTLLRCLNGLIPHFSGGIVEGSVTVGGYDVLEAGPHALSRVVGFVFQDPESQIVVDEVESEVAFGLENAAVPAEVMRDRVEEALRIMGLENLRHRSPWTLSGGERQKLAIATVLADQPSVLALDEPTSQLDPLAARDLLQTLVRLNEELGLTIIMVEQRLERVVQYAGRLVYLERGKVTLDGPMRQELGKLDWGQRPPLARLAGSLSWSTIPLSIAEGRQMVSTDALHVHNGDGRTFENTRSTSMHQAPVLEARNLRFVYNGQEVLRGVDVQVRAGEAVVLLGPNGAGKSTLLKCLVGLLEPECGEVFVHGRSIAGRDVAAVCRQVAYLPQNPDDLLFADSVTEELEITLANHGVNKGETALYIKDLLLELGLADSEGDYPRDLSVGQRQRVALGAVAVVAPTILLLDEPTRGLDYATKESLMSLWRRWLQAGMALLLVTHDVELATRVAQRVIVLEDGRITADGPVEDVLGTLEAFEPQMARLFPGHRWLTVAEVMAGMGSHPAGS